MPWSGTPTGNIKGPASTYSAGTGLLLTGSTFSADTNTLATRAYVDGVAAGVPKPAGYYKGQWTDAGGSVTGTLISGGNGNRIDDIGATSLETGSGCSISSGTFTATQAGAWLFQFTVQFTAGSQVRAIYLAKGNAASNPSGAKYGLLGASYGDALSSSARIVLTAGQTVSVYAAVWQGGANLNVWRSQGNNLTATWMGP